MLAMRWRIFLNSEVWASRVPGRETTGRSGPAESSFGERNLSVSVRTRRYPTGRVEVRALAKVREPRRFLRASVNPGASRRIHQQRRLARFLRRTQTRVTLKFCSSKQPSAHRFRARFPLILLFEPSHRPLLAPIMLTFPSPNITPQTLKASARSRWGRVPASPLRVNSIRQPPYSCCSICSAHSKFPAGSFAFKEPLSPFGAAAGSPVPPRLWNEKWFCSLGRQRFLPRSSICQLLNVPLQQRSIQSLWSCINLSQSWGTF